MSTSKIIHALLQGKAYAYKEWHVEHESHTLYFRGNPVLWWDPSTKRAKRWLAIEPDGRANPRADRFTARLLDVFHTYYGDKT